MFIAAREPGLCLSGPGYPPSPPSISHRGFSANCRTKWRPNVLWETPGAGVSMKHRSEFVPLAVMGSLTAAIMVVFAVTVMHYVLPQ